LYTSYRLFFNVLYILKILTFIWHFSTDLYFFMSFYCCRCLFRVWGMLHCGSFLDRTPISWSMTTFWVAQTAYMLCCSI